MRGATVFFEIDEESLFKHMKSEGSFEQVFSKLLNRLFEPEWDEHACVVTNPAVVGSYRMFGTTHRPRPNKITLPGGLVMRIEPCE